MTRQEQMRKGIKAALAALMIAAGAWMAPAAADEMDVKVGFYPGTMFMLPLYVAEAKGFYKEAGLRPTFIPVPNGPMMNSQMGSGAVEFGFQPPSNVGLAREQGLDQVFIVGNVTMPWVLVARKGLKVPNAGKYPAVMNDLKGLNWGVYARGSDGEIFMRAMAQDAKLDVDKDMTWIGVGGPATGLPSLKSGKVDVYMAIAPVPDIAVGRDYGTVLLDLRKGGGPADFKGIHYNGVVTLRKTAQAKPKAVAAMVAATVKAQCWIRQPGNFNEVLTIAKARMPVSELGEKDFVTMVRENLATFTPTMPAAHFETWNDMLLRAKVLKQPLAAEQARWPTVPATEPAC